MTIPTTSWDETAPAGSQGIKLGDNRIRELKTQIREVVDVDHKFDSSGQDSDMGKHNKVSLLEAADIGTGAEGKTILGGQTVNGKCELVYTDEDDNDVVITSCGGISLPSIKMTDGNLLIGQADGTGEQKAMSGDATIDNAGAVSVSDLTIASQADGDLLQYDGTNWVRVAKGTAGQILESDGTDVLWGAGVASVLDYGTSKTTGTAKTLPAVHICYGTVGLALYSSTISITNLPFTSNTSYVVTVATTSGGQTRFQVTRDSGAQFTVLNNTGGESSTMMWMAIGT